MLVGASPKRKEDGRFVTGRGRYLDDVRVPGLLHAALVRSPHAHARVLQVDAAAARALDGVVAVWTLEHLPELAASVPPLVPEPKGRGYVHPVMAGKRVRHVGEVVAVVIATDPYRAADGAELVTVAYAPLPAAVTPEAATAPGAPRVNEEWPDNVASVSTGGKGDAAAALASAEVVVSARLRYPRVAGMPIETRGVLAEPDPITGGLTVWTSTQVPFAVRSGIAPVLGLSEERVRVIVPDVGGGFGVKGHVYPEEILLPAVARRLGRAVKWTETRSEHCLNAAGDRDQAHDARIAVARDGRIVAIDTAFTRDHGAAPMLGEAITLNTINHLPGPYRVPNYRGVGRNVLTHKTFAAAYRGAGRPEAAFVLDRLLDRAARRLGMDPAELRRINLIRPGEMPCPTGLTYRDGQPIVYDPADYPAAFDRLLAALDYAGWRGHQAARRGSSRPLGIGLCAYVEGTGIGPFEGADVRVDPDGTVFVNLGVCAQGQGHETTLAQICADELGVPLESVAVRGGDTSLVGYGMGTIASRVAAVGGPAVQRSAAQVAHKARLVGAELFECAPTDVVLAEGRVHVRGVPGRGVPLGQVARAAVRSRTLAEAGGPGLSACAFFYPDTVTWAFGVQGVVLEVDLETCTISLLRLAAMHDCGRPINPVIVEGQLHGGIAQGVGSALGEALVYDEAGQLLTGSLMDYFLPRADDMPALDVVHLDFPSPINPLGIKGVGESGVIAPAAAVANAVDDALADYGVEVDRPPVTPARLFELLRAGGRWPRPR
ncbi:MAG TPA: xanthine dehydrogenase family protein molybdopterin-binding subunit [Candidatus Bathyarchaeia archaeon]|nr:xanthine dehydrogenase family protein molybdopterin-binding subunit [Candidatus Bathyarchaeia archaeon]